MKLRISLNRYDKLLFGKVLEMDESLRGIGSLYNFNSCSILSSTFPCILCNELYVRGTKLSFDSKILNYTYDTAETADSIAKIFKTGIEQINNCKIKLKERETFAGGKIFKVKITSQAWGGNRILMLNIINKHESFSGHLYKGYEIRPMSDRGFSDLSNIINLRGALDEHRYDSVETREEQTITDRIVEAVNSIPDNTPELPMFQRYL